MKKLLSLTIVLVLMATMLSGCSGYEPFEFTAGDAAVTITRGHRPTAFGQDIRRYVIEASIANQHGNNLHITVNSAVQSLRIIKLEGHAGYLHINSPEEEALVWLHDSIFQTNESVFVVGFPWENPPMFGFLIIDVDGNETRFWLEPSDESGQPLIVHPIEPRDFTE